MLRLNDIEKSFAGPDGTVTALREINMTIGSGEVIAIHGPSGCGKTTLLLTAGGLLGPTHGSVTLDGKDLYAMSQSQRCDLRSRGIGFVFQQFYLIPYLSVLQNVLVTALPNGSVNESRDRARALLETLQLSHRLSHRPDQLSTGERQRTALARAMLNQPSLILADEPTGNLDDTNGRVVLDALESYARQGHAVLIVTHDTYVLDRLEHTIEMNQGRILAPHQRKASPNTAAPITAPQ